MPPQPLRVTRARGWTLSASSLSRLPPQVAASTGGALERPRGQEQQRTPGLSHETRSPTNSLAQPTSLQNARQYVTDSKDGARRLARRNRVTRSPPPVNVGRRRRRGGRPSGTTRACPVVVDAGQIHRGARRGVCSSATADGDRRGRRGGRPRGTTRPSPSATADGDRRGRRGGRPRGTTRACPSARGDGDRRGRRCGQRGGRPRGTTRACPVVVDACGPASTERHDGGVSCARQPQTMATDRHDVVVDRGARRGRARSSCTADGDRQARRGGAQPKVSPARAGASTVPTNRRCRRVHRWMGGRDEKQPASEAVTLPTGTRVGQGREVQASAAAPTGE